MIPEKSRFSLGKDRRLLLTAEFTRVRDARQDARGPMFILSFCRVPEEKKFRVGLIASRRIGGAVIRNRVRRRLREIVRRHQHEIISGLWMVIIARSSAARATYCELEDEWLRLAKRASILRP